MATYSWTPDYILWKLTLPQVFLWYDRAVESNYGKKTKRASRTAEEINEEFEWCEKSKRWI